MGQIYADSETIEKSYWRLGELTNELADLLEGLETDVRELLENWTDDQSLEFKDVYEEIMGNLYTYVDEMADLPSTLAHYLNILNSYHNVGGLS